jgi:Abortive infection C-terminus
MISPEIATVVPRFFDGGRGPSHDELTRLFERAGLAEADPLHSDPSLTIGKMKRVRAVLGTALDGNREEGGRLVQALVRAVRAYSGFQPGSDNFVGDDLLAEAQRAFAEIGYELSPDGAIHPRRLEELDGAELTEALWAYVRRAREGAGDDALVVGTDKDLLEAVARHALVETTGGYATRENFPATIYQAFERLGLSPAPPSVSDQLDADARAAVQQAVHLLALAVNRLRNEQGTGHGRPVATDLREVEAKIACHATALVCEVILAALEGRALAIVAGADQRAR